MKVDYSHLVAAVALVAIAAFALFVVWSIANSAA